MLRPSNCELRGGAGLSKDVADVGERSTKAESAISSNNLMGGSRLFFLSARESELVFDGLLSR